MFGLHFSIDSKAAKSVIFAAAIDSISMGLGQAVINRL